VELVSFTPGFSQVSRNSNGVRRCVITWLKESVGKFVSVSDRVRTASGSDRIKTQLNRTMIFSMYRLIRSLPLAVLTPGGEIAQAQQRRISREILEPSVAKPEN
jgi:hypothetical protein